MTDHRAIADAGQSLVDLLRTHVTLDGGNDTIVLGTPGTVSGGNRPGRSGGGTAPRLSVYLYRVVPNADLWNAPRQVEGVSGDDDDVTTVRSSPLALDLHYLVTAYPSGSTGGGTGTGATGGTWDQHRVLGWAMQTLADHPTLHEGDLKGSLADGPSVHVTLERTRFEDIVDIWSTFPDRPYEPSVSYVLSPVLVESTRETDGHRVTEREVKSHQTASGEMPDADSETE